MEGNELAFLMLDQQLDIFRIFTSLGRFAHYTAILFTLNTRLSPSFNQMSQGARISKTKGKATYMYRLQDT